MIEGEIIETAPVSPRRSIAVELLCEALRAAFAVGYRVRTRQPIDLGLWFQPEPDAAVVAGRPRDFTEHPTTASLIVEVGESSREYDLRIKARSYAGAGIEDYWIVNLVDRQLEVHRRPGPDPDRKGRFRYAEVTIVPADGRASPLAAPRAVIAVADLLP